MTQDTQTTSCQETGQNGQPGSGNAPTNPAPQTTQCPDPTQPPPQTPPKPDPDKPDPCKQDAGKPDPCKPDPNKPDPCKPADDETDEGVTDPKCPPLCYGPDVPPICKPKPKDCPPTCCCPEKPKETESCFDTLIRKQAQQIAKAKRAEDFKKDIEKILAKAKKAKLDYTKAKHKELSDLWSKEDADICTWIRKVACWVPCWRCVIECEICPLLYAISGIDLELNGNGTLTDKTYSLRDQRNWLARDLETKKAVFKRIQDVLTAWEDPAKAIKDALAENAKLIGEMDKADPVTAISNIFLTLIPKHMAIKPESAVSNIPADWRSLCCGDIGSPDTCCGPDVGKMNVRQGLIGALPYLVDPDKFFEVICCLVTERYQQAKQNLAVAEAKLADKDLEIEQKEADLKERKATLADVFKANVPLPVCCENYKSKPADPGKPDPCKPDPDKPDPGKPAAAAV